MLFMATLQDLRSDRQPEFTQLDLELAFADSDTIMAMMERLMADVFAKVRCAACRFCSVRVWSSSFLAEQPVCDTPAEA
jgi:aspartyl/asparaginyl-tRNA synthetase